jgi:hypothetical protein
MSQPPPWDEGQPPNQGQPSWPSAGQPPSWPSAGQQQQQQQPSSWPAGGMSQDPPPPWPPAGQPPYPGPGHTHGHGPRPPRFRFSRFGRRHPFRGVLIALGLFIVFGFVVRNLTTSHNAVPITPFPSASGSLATGLQAQPGKVGSPFDLRDGHGNTYRVTMVKVIDPARGADQSSSPDAGKRFVGLVFRIRALTGSPQNEDADSNAVLVGGNGQTYSADYSDGIAGYTNFDSGSIHVAQGNTVTGAVTFQVPDGVTISKIQWSALSGFGSMVEWNVHG